MYILYNVQCILLTVCYIVYYNVYYFCTPLFCIRLSFICLWGLKKLVHLNINTCTIYKGIEKACSP